jgi:WhiB family transcriptional regulator, redox-sensing transcriptional regulator
MRSMTTDAVKPLATSVQRNESRWRQPYPCQTENPDLWFAEAAADVEWAKQLCRECPVRLRCLAMALDRGEPWGVWGGEVFDHGRVLPFKRGRGRPRKQAAA